MLLCTDWGTIEVINKLPPPLRERTESYLVLRLDGDEWTVSGEVISPAVLHMISEKWYPSLRDAMAAIEPLCQVYEVRRIYVVDGELTGFNALLQ